MSAASLSLEGFRLGPPQVEGAFRLVPVLRADVPGDLRMGLRRYGRADAVVSLEGELGAPGLEYMSYIPHGLVLRWSDDGFPVAAQGAELGRRDGVGKKGVRLLHRMAKQEDRRRLRILPLHLAMEGFLSLHFGGPDVVWSEYSQRALREGLNPRFERTVPGAWLPGLREALRTFELHEGQVGSLAFVADAFASAFIVSHPEDYRSLHASLLEDFYGDLLLRYAVQFPEPTRLEMALDERRVRSIDDLEREVEGMRAAWSAFGAMMAEGLFEQPLTTETVRRVGPFHLRRFVTALSPREENHIGEGIFRKDGR
ncbi:MAG: hypothetical protein AAFU79_19120, partial [Myxococcota bacterium]